MFHEVAAWALRTRAPLRASPEPLSPADEALSDELHSIARRAAAVTALIGAGENTTERAPLQSVLVVGDDDDVRRSLRDVLEDAGYRVIEAAHGEAALDHLRSAAAPAVILLDLMMPIMNGLSFREKLLDDPAGGTSP